MRRALFLLAVTAVGEASGRESGAVPLETNDCAGLVRKLEDPQLAVRAEAYRELLDRGRTDPEAVLSALPEEPADIEVREKCEELRVRLAPVRSRLRALAAAGEDPARRAAVEDLFERPSGDSVTRFVRAFGDGGGDEAARVLIPFLEHEKRGVAEAAFRSILALAPSDRTVVADIAKLLAQDGDARVYAVGLLAELDAAVLSSRLADLFGDEKPLLRTGAIKAAGRLGLREHAPQIARLLSDPLPGIREAAIEALVGLGAREHLPAIARLVEEGPEPELTLNVRKAALRGVLALGGEASIPQIVGRLLDRDMRLREEAANALVGLKARSAAPAVARLLQHGDGEIRETAASVLVRLKEPSVVPQIAGYLGSDSPGVRAAAALTLGKMGASSAAEKIAGLLSDPELIVREAAVEALGDLGDAAFAPRVAPFLRVMDGGSAEEEPLFDVIPVHPPIRGLAALALGKMRAAAFAEQIRPLLQDEECDVQEAARRALADLKPGTAR